MNQVSYVCARCRGPITHWKTGEEFDEDADYNFDTLGDVDYHARCLPAQGEQLELCA